MRAPQLEQPLLITLRQGLKFFIEILSYVHHIEFPAKQEEQQMRPTVYDIAKDAGVSLATVDRVLNNRPGVRDKTIQQVQDAIEKLGYVRDVAAANLARQRSYDFVCVLPDNRSEFLREVRAAIDEAAAGMTFERTRINVREFPLDDTTANN